MTERETTRTTVSKPTLLRSGVLQRKCDCGQHTVAGGSCSECSQKKTTLQRKASSNGPANEVPAIVHDVLRSPGQPLSAQTRSFFEARFDHDFSQVPARTAMPSGTQGKLTVNAPGDVHEQQADQVAEMSLRAPEGVAPHASSNESRGYDFSGVRVHTDDRAARSAQRMHALAYTVGQNVVFGPGQYRPDSSQGKRLLAHELAHVVQQNGSANVAQRFSTEDCEAADVTRITASHNRAIALVEAAIRRLTADPVTPETQTHFANHFGGYGTWRRDVVVGHFRRDLSLLQDSTMTYECEAECDEGEPAYTYWIFGDIHICLPWLRSQVLTERGETFVHEMHHWDVPRGHLDLGYHKNNQDNQVSWITSVNNADAYSELAQDLYEQP